MRKGRILASCSEPHAMSSHRRNHCHKVDIDRSDIEAVVLDVIAEALAGVEDEPDCEECHTTAYADGIRAGKDLAGHSGLLEAAEQAAADPDYDSDLWGDEALRKWSVNLIADVRELVEVIDPSEEICNQDCCRIYWIEKRRKALAKVRAHLEDAE